MKHKKQDTLGWFGNAKHYLQNKEVIQTEIFIKHKDMHLQQGIMSFSSPYKPLHWRINVLVKLILM